MQRLIQGLLSYSRVVHDTEKQFVPVCPNAVLSQVLEGLHEAILESGAEITCGTLPAVLANPLHLGQILQNLISNSLNTAAIM